MEVFYILIIISCIHSMYAAVPAYFYPFGPDQGDNVVPPNDDESSGEVDISVQFPFFDQLHSSLYVNTNGVISFLTEVSQFVPDAFPLADNRRLVAPFWADIDSTENDGAVYYKETQDPSILLKATQEVRAFFVEHPNFQALWAFIATWDRVTYYGGAPDTAVNTFQAVLTTNGRHSFVIFNYGDITWTYGDASEETPAQVGFNAGDGIRFFNVPGSRTPAISDVELTTNIAQPGRWVFQVDEANVEAGGCNTEGSVVLGSRFSLALGGKLIHVAGPCFNITQDEVVCDFDGVMVQGEVLTATRAACVSPATFTLGKRPFRLSVDGGNTFDYTGDFWFVEEYSIVQVNPPAWLELDLFQDLQIEWDPDLLTSSTVSVHFVTFSTDKTGNVEMIEVPLSSSTVNSGSFQIPDILENTNDLPIASFGAIRITELGVASQRTQSLWSPVSPAVWYTNRYLYTIAIYGPNPEGSRVKRTIGDTASQAWEAIVNFVDTTTDNVKEAVSEKLLDISDYLFEDNCIDWHAEEQANPPDLSDVPIPPCTMDQATNDTANFEPDDACNMGQGHCDFFHPGAFHCVRSVRASPSGAGQQACYNREGQLLPFENGGGTVDRAHAKGHLWTLTIPYFSHFYKDVLPFFYCCKLSKDNCDKYGEVRPTIPCDGYEPPPPAWTGGDPHAVTFDGVQYTFNGVGEYWLVKIDLTMQMQGRAEPITSGSGSASVWTALAMKISTSNTVQVQTNERSGLETMIDGNRVDFDERMTWEYDGVTVTASVGTTQVKVQFLDGSHVQVIHVDGSLSFQITVAQIYKGQTRGLLGVWNDDKTDDFFAPDGSTIDISSSSPRDIHDFGNKWRITEAESLFEYPAGSSYTSFQDLSFVPTLDLPMDDPEAVRICDSSTQCKFDYLVTGSTSIAQQTKQSMMELAMVRMELQPVVTCGFPTIPENGFGNTTNGPAGVTVRFQCNPGFMLMGSAYRTCQENGQWSGQTPQCTVFVIGSGTKAITMGLPVFLVLIAVDLYLILPLKD